MFNAPEFKVGVFIVVVATIIGAMTLKVTKGISLLNPRNRYHFELENASGLIKNSAVKMAGIKVGIIEDVVLKEGRAHLKILVNKDVPLTTLSVVEIRSDGILGDKHIELVAGSTSDAYLKDGDWISNTKEKGSFNEVLNEVGEISKSLKGLSETLTKAVQNDGDSSSPVGRIILNIEKLTKDLSDITGENKEKVNDIIHRIQRITKNIDETVNDESDEGFKAAWKSAVSSLKRIDTSLRNIEEVTEKINRGEGTIGRLLNEDDTVEKINAAVDNFNSFLGGTNQMETSVDFHSEFLSSQGVSKSYLGFKIQPGLDRYYDIQIVDDPNGVTSKTKTTTTGTSTSDVTEEKVDYSKIKFTVLFAKNFYDFTVKGGLMESTGGVGFDYYLLNKKLRLSLEMFNFEDLKVKSFVRYDIFNGVYLIGGGHDITDSQNADAFFGAGVFLTNDDLKVLATKAGLN